MDPKDPNTDFKWSVFIKHPFNESLRPYVKSVTFFLHESFEAPIRRIKEEPFMLIETGWGEFNIEIQLELQDQFHNQTIQIQHFLEVS